jgi:hypothetical protein
MERTPAQVHQAVHTDMESAPGGPDVSGNGVTISSCRPGFADEARAHLGDYFVEVRVGA